MGIRPHAATAVLTLCLGCSLSTQVSVTPGDEIAPARDAGSRIDVVTRRDGGRMDAVSNPQRPDLGADRMGPDAAPDIPPEMDAFVPACPSDPIPVATPDCPGVCNGGCVGDICQINCHGEEDCKDDTIVCPEGLRCDLDCRGTKACENVRFNCPALYSCSVRCSETDACKKLDLNCGAASCQIICNEETCNTTEVNCGAGACTATCEGPGPEPVLSCSASCECTGC